MLRLAPAGGDVSRCASRGHVGAIITTVAQPLAVVSILRRAALYASRVLARPTPERAYLGLVLRAMGTVRQESQVLASIITTVVIDVVDMFCGQQRPAQHICHKQAMLEHVARLIRVRVFRLPDFPVTMSPASSALPARTIRPSAMLSLRRVACVSLVGACTRAEHAPNDLGRCPPNNLTAGNAGIWLFHIPMIAQAA